MDIDYFPILYVGSSGCYRSKLLMKTLKFMKNTGCILEVIVFSNGRVASCWQTGVPEVAVYDNLDMFLKVRTPERGYTQIE